jgi:hypothetical protein
VAIERVPPRREAGAGLALPVFNKECEAPLIFFRAKRGAIFRVLVILRVCVGRTICGAILGAIRSGFPYPFEASGFEASGALGELRNTFGLLSFSFSGAFVFFFSLSFIAFSMRES